MTAEMEKDLGCIVYWGERWLVSFNATKTKLLLFNPHRESSLIPLRMNDIELPESASFHLLGLGFYNRHHKELDLFFYLIDTLQRRPLCPCIKPQSGPV